MTMCVTSQLDWSIKEILRTYNTSTLFFLLQVLHSIDVLGVLFVLTPQKLSQAS